MSVAVVSRVPTLENARAVAEACGEAHGNVEDVLVFGSVARGDAGAGSDIDLLVLVSEKVDRHGVRLYDVLSEVARTVSEVRCDVAVRTAFEWEYLVANVSASFEASIEPETFSLFRRESSLRQPVRGGLDEMPAGMPTDNGDVAAKLARRSAALLEDVFGELQGFYKTGVVLEGFDLDDHEERELHYAQRVLALSHDGLGLFVKAIGAAALGKSLNRTHSLDELVNELRENAAERSDVVETVDNVLGTLRNQEGETKNWHVVMYEGEEAGWVEESTVVNALNHVEALLAMTRIVTVELDNMASLSGQPARASKLLTKKIAQIENTPGIKAALEQHRGNRDTPEHQPDVSAHDGPDIDF